MRRAFATQPIVPDSLTWDGDFKHKRRGLRRVQAVADHKAAVIVEEGDQVHSAILALERESEEITLPEQFPSHHDSFLMASAIDVEPGIPLHISSYLSSKDFGTGNMFVAAQL